MTRPSFALGLPAALAAFVVAAVVAIVGAREPAAAQEPPPARASPGAAPADAAARPLEPFVIEYYYKAKWGHAAEFFRLFRKNYLPLLRAMEKQGRILSIEAHSPRHHASEESRWDWRITVTWRDVVTAHDDHHPESLIRELFPDFERHQEEEKRRFEILIAHWDVLVEEEKLADGGK